MLVTYNTDREMKRKCTYQLIFFLFLHQQQLWTFVHPFGGKQRCFPKFGRPLSSRAHSSPCGTEWICDHYRKPSEFCVNGTKYNNKNGNKKHNKKHHTKNPNNKHYFDNHYFDNFPYHLVC